jgi:hypothetical protein
MAGVDPISAGLGAVSLISGKNQQRRAQSSANRAQATEAEMIRRATEFMDLMLGKAKEAEGQGLFDPEKRFGEMRGTIDRENNMASAQLAGDLRIAGGHPGERAVTTRLAGLKESQISKLALLKDALKQESFFNKLQAYGAANPAQLGSLSAGIAGNQATRAYGQMPNPTGFFQSIMPFMQGGQSRRPSTLETGVLRNMGRSLTAFA